MFIHNGGAEEQKGVKSNPTRGRNQRSKAGIYSEGLCPSLDKRKCQSSSACVFLSCIQMNVCASCVLQRINWKVFLSCIWSTWSHLSLAAREVAFFFPYFFIHSFIFLPHISPGLPSSHPNQRTHRRLLGTPCPGNPPCIARYLEETALADQNVGNKAAVKCSEIQ